MSTNNIPEDVRFLARSTVRFKIGGLVTGKLGLDLSDEVADAVLNSTWTAIRDHFADLLIRENPDRNTDFSRGVD